MKKVVFLVQNNFLNESRILKEAISLRNNGYSTLVVALYEEGLKIKEVVSGVDIERIRLITRSLSKHIIFKLVKYVEFLMVTICRYTDCDVYHCHDLDTLPIAFILRMFNRKVKIVYDASEFATESNGLTDINKRVRRVIEGFLIKRTEAVLTVSRSIAAGYASLYSIKKPYTILNTPGYIKCKKTCRFREEFDIPDSKVILLYQGFFWPGRGIENIIKSIPLIKSESCVVFMGRGNLVDYVKKKTKEYPGKVYYKSSVSPSELLDYTASADIGLCIIENVCLSYYYSLPNKLFQYLMAGLPVIVSDFPEMSQLIKHEFDCGLTVDPASPKDIASGVDRLTSNKDLFNAFKANTELAARKYNWENEEKALLGIYEKL